MALSQKKQLVVTLGGAVILAAALGAYAWLGVFESEKADEARKDEEAKLFALDPKTVNQLEVSAKGETTRLERSGEDWRITSPVEAPADLGTVRSLLDRLASAKREKLVEEKTSDEKLFGLDAPAVRVIATTSSGERAELAVGAQNTFDGSWFVSPGAGLIASADAGLKNELEKTTFDLRDKRLIVFGEDALTSIAVTGSSTYTLGRVDSGWQLEGEAPEPAGEKPVGELLRALHDLRALSFPGEKEGGFGLEQPALILTLARKDLPPLSLRIGTAGDQHYAQLEGGAVAEVPSKILQDLARQPSDLRAPPPAPEAPEGERAQALDEEAE